MKWIKRRWICFRQGHDWLINLPFGPDQCKRCGKLVEW